MQSRVSWSVIPPSPFVQGPRTLYSHARGASEGCFSAKAGIQLPAMHVLASSVHMREHSLYQGSLALLRLAWSIPP